MNGKILKTMVKIEQHDWWSSDQPERAIPNYSEDISYDLQRYGSEYFRTRHSLVELDENSNIALGCSCTFGVGVAEKKIWTTLLEEKTGRKTHNLGVPGGSLETCFRVLLTHLPRLGSKYVYMQCPATIRREVHKELYSSWNVDNIGHKNVNHPFSIDWLFSETELSLNRASNMHAIQSLCDSYGAELRIFRSDDREENNDLYRRIAIGARDNMHPGSAWHSLMAEHFIRTPADKRRVYTYAVNEALPKDLKA